MSATNTSTGFFASKFKKLSFQVILLILIFIACCWGLLAIADMVFEDKSLAFDERVFLSINPYYSSSNTAVMKFITFFGSQFFLLPANIILVLTFLLKKTRRTFSLKIASVAITSTAVMFLLKEFLKRERPIVPLISKAHGYSFPSGHTFTSIVFFGMLSYIAYKNIGSRLLKWVAIALCWMLALLVGFSRIYLKLHYASDVIAGILLGIIWLLLAKWLLIKAEKIPIS